MPATGYTPIIAYHSVTAGHIPVNTNLSAGELAINTADGIIYYTNPSNVVTPFSPGISAGKAIIFSMLFGL